MDISQVGKSLLLFVCFECCFCPVSLTPTSYPLSRSSPLHQWITLAPLGFLCPFLPLRSSMKARNSIFFTMASSALRRVLEVSRDTIEHMNFLLLALWFLRKEGLWRAGLWSTVKKCLPHQPIAESRCSPGLGCYHCHSVLGRQNEVKWCVRGYFLSNSGF